MVIILSSFSGSYYTGAFRVTFDILYGCLENIDVKTESLDEQYFHCIYPDDNNVIVCYYVYNMIIAPGRLAP